MNRSSFRTSSGLQLETRVRVPTELTPEERGQMLALMTDYYEQVDPDQFEYDLLEKDWAIVTSEPTRGIMGFTTLARMATQLHGVPLEALFSGDTVLDPDIWGATNWARVWGRHAASLMQESPGTPLYWLLLTATHRTYRFLPAFLREYYPRPDLETPPIFCERVDALVRLKFPRAYDAERGVVRSEKPLVVRQLRTELAEAGLDDAHGKFFSERNPGYLQGDYLVCIGDLSAGNRTRLGERFFALDDV